MHLATVSSKSVMPRVVPVWYMYKNDKFYIGTHTKTTKAKNIAKTAHAGFCIDKGIHAPIFGVAGYGSAKLITNTNMVITHAKDILNKYDISESTIQDILAKTDCIIIITPEKMSSWSY